MVDKEKDEIPDYWRDPELDRIGKELRLKHHEHLHDADLSFVMTKKPMTRGGQAIFGKAQLANGLLGFYSKADFVITISAEAWDKADVAKRRAMVDHELCHCTCNPEEDGSQTWTLGGHDIEEFTKIVDRHGLWKEDLQVFGQAVGRQLELGLTPKGEAKKAV